MEKIIWTDRVRNKDVLHSVKEERSVLHTMKRRKANWIGHVSHRNCLLKQVAERKKEGTRRGRRYREILNDVKEKRKYWNLK
jgi:hypothetical protein